MRTILLSLGSNRAPERHLPAAMAALRGRFGPLRASPGYRTRAVGFSGPDFVNSAVAFESDIGLDALEAWLHALEDAQGRDRSAPRMGNRTLDIDVVFYGDAVLEAGGRRRVPRPELRHAFVLKPMADVAPEFVDPISGSTLAVLWAAHPDHATFPAPEPEPKRDA